MKNKAEDQLNDGVIENVTVPCDENCVDTQAEENVQNAQDAADAAMSELQAEESVMREEKKSRKLIKEEIKLTNAMLKQEDKKLYKRAKREAKAVSKLHTLPKNCNRVKKLGYVIVLASAAYAAIKTAQADALPELLDSMANNVMNMLEAPGGVVDKIASLFNFEEFAELESKVPAIKTAWDGILAGIGTSIVGAMAKRATLSGETKRVLPAVYEIKKHDYDVEEMKESIISDYLEKQQDYNAEYNEQEGDGEYIYAKSEPKYLDKDVDEDDIEKQM